MKKGFTLVELLAVIIILGAIFAITFPLVKKNRRKSFQSSKRTNNSCCKRYGNKRICCYT